jgi:hypothetical protein
MGGRYEFFKYFLFKISKVVLIGFQISDMTSEGLGEMFEGDSADMCGGKFPLVLMGGQAECLAIPSQLNLLNFNAICLEEKLARRDRTLHLTRADEWLKTMDVIFWEVLRLRTALPAEPTPFFQINACIMPWDGLHIFLCPPWLQT